LVIVILSRSLEFWEERSQGGGGSSESGYSKQARSVGGVLVIDDIGADILEELGRFRWRVRRLARRPDSSSCEFPTTVFGGALRRFLLLLSVGLGDRETTDPTSKFRIGTGLIFLRGRVLARVARRRGHVDCKI
jgi:hypothetical protein